MSHGASNEPEEYLEPSLHLLWSIFAKIANGHFCKKTS